MTWVFEHSEATLGARLVLLALADYAHDDGSKAFPSVDTLATHARLSRRGVQAALRKLEEEEHIEATGKTKYGTTIYTIRGVVASPRADVDRGGEVHDQGGEVRAQNRSSASPDPLKSHQGATINPPASPDGEDSSSLSVLTREVFDYWKTSMGLNGNARLTADRRQKVVARLKEKITVEEIKRAIDGVAASDFHRKNNHDDLELICRKGSNVQRYAKLPLDGNLTDHQRQVVAAVEAAPTMSDAEAQAAFESVGLAA